MSALDKAISEQISRYLEEDKTEVPSVKAEPEIGSLLQAFMSLINAYLLRVGKAEPAQDFSHKVSNTFASNG